MARKASKKRKKSRPLPRPLPKRRARLERGVKRKVRKAMSDKPKPWPYEAGHDRDQAAEEANVIVKHSEEALEMTNDPGLLKKIGRILASANVIARLLERHGAKTRPPER